MNIQFKNFRWEYDRRKYVPPEFIEQVSIKWHLCYVWIIEIWFGKYRWECVFYWPEEKREQQSMCYIKLNHTWQIFWPYYMCWEYVRIYRLFQNIIRQIGILEHRDIPMTPQNNTAANNLFYYVIWDLMPEEITKEDFYFFIK